MKDLGTVRFPDSGWVVSRRTWEEYTSQGDDFSSPTGRTEWRMGFSRGTWSERMRRPPAPGVQGVTAVPPLGHGE